jgi:hypothetical protein
MGDPFMLGESWRTVGLTREVSLLETVAARLEGLERERV